MPGRRQPPDDSPAPDRQERSAAPAGKDESLREEALALLDERERALADGDREAFLATVDPDELGFSATQARWFDNLARLPVGDVSFELGDEDALADDSDDGELRLPVEFTMRLRGFDGRPVTAADGVDVRAQRTTTSCSPATATSRSTW